jgi:hypothetical protein
MEHDAKRAQAKASRQDYLSKMRALTSSSKHSINFNQMLEEGQILLSLREMDLELREVKLAEEQACDLHSFDGWDLMAELEELHTHMAGVKYEHAAKASKLSTLVVGISNALVNLRRLPIYDTPIF